MVALGWFVLSLGIDNEPKLLRVHPAGAHSPDVDYHSSSHCHNGLFLERFVGAAKALAPMQDGAVVGLKTDQPPNQFNTFGSQPSRTHLGDRAQALSRSSGILSRDKTEKAGHLPSIAKAAPNRRFPDPFVPWSERQNLWVALGHCFELTLFCAGQFVGPAAPD